MKRFGLKFDNDNSITMWDNAVGVPMTSGGEPMRFPAHEHCEADRIRHVMNQRFEHPELTRADGKLVKA